MLLHFVGGLPGLLKSITGVGLELAGALAGGSPPHNAAGDSTAFV